jgi:hypothetical protein
LFERLYREWPMDSAEVVTLERTLELEIDGVRWRGRADRIERTATGAIRIVDYKTGGTPLTKVEAGRSLQLGFYVMAAAADRLSPHPVPRSRPSSGFRWPRPSRGARHSIPPCSPPFASGCWRPPEGIGERGLDTPGRAGCRTCPVRLVCDRWPEGREAFVE